MMKPTAADPSSLHLRTIPEDQSDASSSALQLPENVRRRQQHDNDDEEVASSTKTVLDGRSGSLISDAVAVLAEDAGGAAARGVDHDHSRHYRWSRSRILYTTAVIVLIVAVVLSVTLVATVRPKSGSGDPPDSEDSESVAAIDAVLKNVSDPALFEDASTPQYAAREWMLNTDLLREDVATAGDDAIIQRYVLVEFYFAMGGNDWYDNITTFLEPTQTECSWSGVTCSSEDDAVIRLHLAGGNLSGELPIELRYLTELQELGLNSNSIKGSIPGQWFEGDNVYFQDLYWLDLSQNQLSGSIPAPVWNLPVLRFLYVSENVLSGEIVKDSNKTVSTLLQDCWLFDNMLQGGLPDWMSRLVSLQTWIAHDNELTGHLPGSSSSSLQLPGNLTHLDLSRNNLTGPVSAALFEQESLQILYVDHNQLNGSLPDYNSNNDDDETNRVLLKVWLHANALEGPIPDGFATQWAALEDLLLHNNRVTGILGPSAAAQCDAVWPQRKRIEADCSNDTNGEADVICFCCSLCH